MARGGTRRRRRTLGLLVAAHSWALTSQASALVGKDGDSTEQEGLAPPPSSSLGPLAAGATSPRSWRWTPVALKQYTPARMPWLLQEPLCGSGDVMPKDRGLELAKSAPVRHPQLRRQY